MRSYSCLVAAFILAAFSSSATANSIGLVDIFGNDLTAGRGGPQYTASCEAPGVCMRGFLIEGWELTRSDSSATGFGLWNASPRTELASLNLLLAGLGESPSVREARRFDGSFSTLTTDRRYFALSQGGWTAFFENLSGGALSVAVGPESFSHWTDFGAPVTVVPLPAAAPLFLSGLGLLGLAGWHSRRGRKRA